MLDRIVINDRIPLGKDAEPQLFAVLSDLSLANKGYPRAARFLYTAVRNDILRGMPAKAAVIWEEKRRRIPTTNTTAAFYLKLAQGQVMYGNGKVDVARACAKQAYEIADVIYPAGGSASRFDWLLEILLLEERLGEGNASMRILKEIEETIDELQHGRYQMTVSGVTLMDDSLAGDPLVDAERKWVLVTEHSSSAEVRSYAQKKLIKLRETIATGK